MARRTGRAKPMTAKAGVTKTKRRYAWVDSLKRFTDKEKRLSKYAACEYLNVSRATFDNYVREGKLPRGKHEAGFKELSWDKKTLDEFIRRNKTRN